MPYTLKFVLSNKKYGKGKQSNNWNMHSIVALPRTNCTIVFFTQSIDVNKHRVQFRPSCHLNEMKTLAL